MRSLFSGLVMATALTTTLLAPAAFAALQPDDITGVWQTESGGYVQIYKANEGYDGKIVGSVDGKPRIDNKNPDADKKGRRLLGVVILSHLKAEDDGAYDQGRIYDPNNGKTYNAQGQLTDIDTLDARGYIGISLLGKTQTWHRIDPKAEHVHADQLVQPVGAAPKASR